MEPNKSLGQHFLKNEFILQKIAHLAILNVPIIEIGAGKGELTKYLRKKAKVLAIEKDKRFKKLLGGLPNTKVIIGDALTVLDSELPVFRSHFQIFGNLPFNIEKPLIQKVLKLKPTPQKAVFLIQKEVAEKFCGKKKSIFALSVEFYAKTRCLFPVPKTAFSPIPKVDGQIIELTEFGWVLPFKKICRRKNEKDFLRLIKLGFASPRKKLINNLATGFNIEKEILQKILFQAKINKDKRAEDLNLNDWLFLFSIFKKRNVQPFPKNKRDKRKMAPFFVS